MSASRARQLRRDHARHGHHPIKRMPSGRLYCLGCAQYLPDPPPQPGSQR